MPEDGELSMQNIKDRYYGVNDPVANKMLRKAEDFAKLVPPDDKDVTTLYVGNVDPSKVTEEDVKGAFYAFGELRSIKLVPHQNCAFVSYTTRSAAEAAAEKLYNRLNINGTVLRISWGKPPSMQSYGAEGRSSATQSNDFFSLPAPSSSSATIPTTPQPLNFFFPTPPTPVSSAPQPKPFYPSMDPNIFGAPHPKAQ